MPNDPGGQALKKFFERYGGMQLFSTGATTVDYADPLYNVIGSTGDPHIGKMNWKQLLESRGINGPCYVTDPLPTKKTTHPKFCVGGHMTPNNDGSAQKGGVCYLMPLCYWHNGGKKGVAFQHAATRMLQLSGYLEGEPAATFLARQSSGPSFRLVSAEADRLTTTLSVAEPDLARASLAGANDGPRPEAPRYHLLFRRVPEGDAERFEIVSAELPK